VNASTYNGTKYRMAYNFKAGYSYVIHITASADLVGTTGPWLRVDIDNYGGGGGTCNGPQSISPNLSGNPAAIQVNSTTFIDYQFSIPNLSAAHPTLEISAIPDQNAGLKNILIRKIEIIETPPPVSFTLPTSVNIPCGSTDPQTFTITNEYNSPGVTGYTWNLSSSNGWLYNGSPAPATISTSTNSLTLTPVCGVTPNDISATVAIGSSNYNTNTLKPVITAPPIVINGSDNICSGSQTYTAMGVPCGAVVSWSVSPSGIVSISPNGNQVTLTRVNDGSVTLTAALSTPCNGSVSKSISVGILMSGNVNNGGKNTILFTVNSVAAGPTLVNFSWPGVTGISCFQSSTNPPKTKTGFIYYPSNSSFWFTLAKGETIDVQFTGTASCGSVNATRTFTVPGYYTLSPNPAGSTVLI
ncbi:MAG: hypothetical protein ACRDE2_15325, partial [Chitinophagaceae bacterium]